MLNIGDHIKLVLYNSVDECIVKRQIAGRVFEVLLDDCMYALKWFDADDYLHYDRAYYDNILYKCKMGSPNNNFIWPINITDYSEQGFGYLMKKIPEVYICMTDWLLGRVQVSTQTLIRVALNLVYLLRSLGVRGLCGADLHDGNIFFDPKTGDALIGDTDEIKPYGLQFLIEPVHLYNNIYCDSLSDKEYVLDSKDYFRYGMKRYQAPETVLNNTVRNHLSDRHSLCVLLFMLLYKAHPLEGKKAVRLDFSEDIKDDIYGKNPLFIFDPTDSSNAPYEPISKFVLAMWELTPDYMKEIFETAFSQASLKKPSRRPIELEWLKCLARWDAEIEKCDSCGNYFTSTVETINVCPICGYKSSLKYYVEFEGNNYTVQAGNKIRRCLANITDNELLSPIATFIPKNGNEQAIGIKNCSRDGWMCINNEGKKKILGPGRIIKIFDGLYVNTPFGNITVHEKREVDSTNNVSLQNTYLHAFEKSLVKIEQKELLVVFVVDTSNSMKGSPISIAYHFIEDTLAYLQEYSKHQSDTEVKFSIMEFNTRIKLLTGNTPVSFEDEFEYEYPDCIGISDLGGVLKELNQKLNKKYFMPPVNAGRNPPIILFFTDGCEPFSFYGYGWREELDNIKDNRWFKNAIKLAVCTSENSDLGVIAKLVGTNEAVLDAADANLIKHLLSSFGVLRS